MMEPKDLTGKLKGKMNPEEKPKEQAKHMAHYQNEQQSIIRQSCLKAAASIVAGNHPLGLGFQEAQSATAEMAEYFVHFVNKTGPFKDNS